MDINDDFEKIIKSFKVEEYISKENRITRFDVKSYIRENGKIKDKKLAIALLCMTSEAWETVDDDLKYDDYDNDVLMFYQPMGYYIAGSYDRGTSTEGCSYYCEPSFVKAFGYYEAVKNIILFRPEFKYLSGKIADKYYGIQEGMLRKRRLGIGTYQDSLFFKKCVFSCSFSYDSQRTCWNSGTASSTTLLDRDYLKELVFPYLTGERETVFEEKRVK